MKSLNIMTGLSGDNEIFVNYEAFKEIIDKLVFQYIRETFKIKKEKYWITNKVMSGSTHINPVPNPTPGVNGDVQPKSDTSSQQGDQSFL